MGVRVLSKYLRPCTYNSFKRAAMGMSVQVRGAAAGGGGVHHHHHAHHACAAASASVRGQRAAAQAAARHGGVLAAVSARQYAASACVYASSSLGSAAHGLTSRGFSVRATAFAADDGLQAEKEEVEELAVDEVDAEALNFAEDGAEEPACEAPSAPANDGVDPCKVWVGNLPWEVEVEDLRNLGEEFGAVVDVTVRPPRAVRTRGRRPPRGRRRPPRGGAGALRVV